MQSLKSERAKKEYEQFVKEVTPKQNLFCNMAKAFIVGGLICVVGQILLHIGKTQFSLSKDDAGSWCSLILILSSVILTGLNIYQKIVTFAGCGALVPITGFANSVAAPAIEYKKEGQVFGIGAKIFTIAGPVILYGVFASWLLGFLYWPSCSRLMPSPESSFLSSSSAGVSAPVGWYFPAFLIVFLYCRRIRIFGER